MSDRPRRPASGAGEGKQQWSHGRPGYLSIERAAQWTSVSTRTIKRWIKAGLPVHQAGPREKVLIRLEDIDYFLTRKQMPQPDLNAMAEKAMAAILR